MSPLVNPSSTRPAVVTALPGSPVSGDEIYLQTVAMAALSPPRMWHLRYNGTRWLPVGAAPLFAEVNGQAIFTSSSYGDPTSGGTGPAVDLPLAGDWEIAVGAWIYHEAAGNSTMVAYTIGATAASDNDAASFSQPSGAASAAASVACARIKTGLDAVTVTAKYRTTSGTGTQINVSRRWIRATYLG